MSHGGSRKGAYSIFKKVSSGVWMYGNLDSEWTNETPGKFERRTKDTVTQGACAENTRGYHSKYANSLFNTREKDDAL